MIENYQNKEFRNWVKKARIHIDREIPLYHNKDWLYEQYIILKRTVSEIGKLCGCNRQSINYRLRKYNILKRSKTSKIKKKHDKKEKIFIFRGIECPPKNEMGVIVLFSLLLNELNMKIVNIQAEFPDCLVQQNKNGKEQMIRIEFEYLSNNFRLHKHNPNECDMIVCWEDNIPIWYKCPIEIIELKNIINTIKLFHN